MLKIYKKTENIPEESIINNNKNITIKSDIPEESIIKNNKNITKKSDSIPEEYNIRKNESSINDSISNINNNNNQKEI